MVHILKFCSNLLIAFTLFVLALAFVNGFTSILRRPTPEILTHMPVQSVGEVEALSQLEVMIPVENPSSRTITILGSSYACYQTCCVQYADGAKQIQAHSAGSVRVRLYTKGHTGDFSAPIMFYTDLDGQPEFTVQVEGRVVASAPAPKT